MLYENKSTKDLEKDANLYEHFTIVANKNNPFNTYSKDLPPEERLARSKLGIEGHKQMMKDPVKYEQFINRLKEYEINPVVADSWADKEIAKHEYGVDLVDVNKLPKADCVIVAVGHNEFRSMSTMQLKELFKESLPDEEKVLIDVKSLYRMDELKASGIRFWRL